MVDYKNILYSYNWVSLIIIIILCFNLVNPIFFKNRIEHNAPQGYLAGDAYWHLVYANHILKQGFYNREPGITTGYNPDKVSPVEPPIFFYINALFSTLFRIPAYDAAIFLLFFTLILGVAVLYFILDKIHPLLPYLSLPLVLLQFTFPFLAGITWGFWKFFLTGILLFVSLAIFFTTKRTWKNSILMGVLLAIIIISHPSMSPYFAIAIILSYAYDILLNHELRNLKHFLKHSLIAFVGLLISLDYLLDFYATRAGTSIYKTTYHLYGATPYASHFGLLWWLLILGFLSSLFFIKFKETHQKKLVFVFGIFFLNFLGPLIGFSRVYQFRLLWPLYISIFLGIFFLVIINLVKLKTIYKSVIAVVIFVILSTYLYSQNISDVKGIGDNTYSLVEDSYWQGIEMMSNMDGSRIFVIDPMLTQGAVMFNLYQDTRYLANEAVTQGIGLVNYSYVPCTITPPLNRVGFITFTDNPSGKSYCENQLVDLCNFNYFLIHTRVTNQQQYDWLEAQMLILQERNLTPVWNSDTAIVLKNEDVC